MIYLLALLPATVLTVAGYFALYVSHRSEGSFRAFGKYLGFWAFTLAGLVMLGALFAAAHRHGHRYGAMMRERHGMMHHPWGGDPRFDAPGFGGAPDAGPPADGAPRPAPQNPAPPAAPAR
jgi:hypothetical protein